MPKSTSTQINKTKPIEPNKQSISIYIIISIIALIIISLTIILHYAMYTWTTELEKNGCECSNLWHRDFINILVSIIVIMIITILVIMFLNTKYNLSSLISYLSFINGVIFFTYILIILDYISKLKALNCECSESWKREYGYIFSIVYISLYILIFIFTIITFILAYMYYPFFRA